MRKYCSLCGGVTEWIPVSTACSATGFARRTIYHWIEREWLHANQLPNGYWLVCTASLPTESRRASIEALARNPGPPVRDRR